MRAFSYFYWFLFVLSLPVFFSVAVVIFLATFLFDRRRVVLHLYACFWGCFYIYANPLWHLKVEGRERLPWKAGAVIVVNHASLIDIIAIYALYRPFKWVSKASNFKLPIIGWFMRMNGYIPLVRGKRESVIEMMRRCRDCIEMGVPVLFFPEGTRSPTGELQAFKDGAFQLAWETGCPVFPVALHGTGRALPKHGMVLREHVRARMEVLPSLDPKDFETVAALRDASRAAISSALGSQGTGPK